MINEQTIQLPPDASANKNLLRAFSVNLPTGTAGTANAELHQVIAIADEFGNVVGVSAGGLAVQDDTSRQLLADIRDRLDMVISLLDSR